MWTLCVQIILGACLAILLIWIVRAKNKRIRKGAVIGAIAVLCVGVLAGRFPIENLVYTFPTIESAAEYRCRRGDKILDVVSGTESSMVVYQTEEGEYHVSVFPRVEKGYKLTHSFFSGKQVAQNELYSGWLYHCGNDRYAFVVGISRSAQVEVKDSSASTFSIYVRKLMNDSHYDMGQFTVCAFAHIEEYGQDYAITLEEGIPENSSFVLPMSD